MNYEQLLSSVFSCFHGLKIILKNFKGIVASALKSKKKIRLRAEFKSARKKKGAQPNPKKILQGQLIFNMAQSYVHDVTVYPVNLFQWIVKESPN